MKKLDDFLSKYDMDELFALEGLPETKEDYELLGTLCDAETFIELHHNSKLLFPSYMLRFGSFDEMPKQTEETLNVLLETGSIAAYDEMKNRYGQKLSKAPDEFLVIGAQSEDGFHERDLLTEIYNPYIEKIINRVEKRYFFRGQDRDDLLQEAFMGFLKAIEVYKVERRTKFKDFSRHVIERHLGTLMNRSRNLRNRALNESFSYNMPVNTNNETTFEDLLEGEPILPEDMYLKRELYKEIKMKLTENEQEVLVPYSQGFTYEEIAFELIKKKGVMNFSNLGYNQVANFMKAIETLEKREKEKDLYDNEKRGNEKESEKYKEALELVNRIQKMDEYQFDGDKHSLCGYTYENIAKEMKRRKKSVDNTIQRIRNKGTEHRTVVVNGNE